MPDPHRCSVQYPLLCTLCGREIVPGNDYWVCNGNFVCADCLGDFARLELAACRRTRGKEHHI